MPYYPGSFLVARPLLQDPNFRQTVVLLLQHLTDGALGLVVNRRAQVKAAPFPIFAGGPCTAPGLLMLHGQADWLTMTPPEKPVAPGVWLGNADCLKQASAAPAGANYRFRVFSGYAGWGAGQLESELASGAWLIVPATGALLFDTPPEDLWDRLGAPRLPSFSVN